MSDLNSKKFDQLTPKEQEKIIELGKIIKKAIEVGDTEKLQDMSKNHEMLLLLLEYLILNLDSPNFDHSLLKAIKIFLGIELEKDKTMEEEKEEELSEEEKQKRLRFAIYEMYKILNPKRLAGETSIENFINNVRARGVDVAMKYEGKEFAKYFKKEDLENLESYKKSFVKELEKEGHKGHGRGI